MNRVRTTALTALGFLGTHALAEEPVWKAPALVPAGLSTPAAGPLPIPAAPAASQPTALGWSAAAKAEGGRGKADSPESPSTLSPVPLPPSALNVAPPPAFPVIVSDFTQQAPTPPAIYHTPVEPARAVAPPPVAPPPRPVEPAKKPAVPAKPAEVPTELPKVVDPPKAVETPKPAPAPVEAPKPTTNDMPPVEPIPPMPVEAVPPQALPPGITPAPAAPADCGPLLEPAPYLGGSPLLGAGRRGVFGSPAIRLSRDYALRDGVGLDMERPQNARLLETAPRGDNWFVQGEFLLWFVNPARIPTLATTNTLGTPGFLGAPGTVSLLGPGTFGPTTQAGLRLRAGRWFDDECEAATGWDASAFFLGRATKNFSVSGLPVISRPFTAAGDGQQVEVVAQPGISVGRLEVDTDRFLWGADVNVKCAISRDCEGVSAFFAGYRTLTLRESLTVQEFITSTGGVDPAGTQVYVKDHFRTRNTFHGGQVGYALNRSLGRFDVDARASVALGATRETVAIDGFQARTPPGGATQFFTGGLLAVGSNIGEFSQTKFAVVPEATFNLGYAVTPNLRAYVGYNFLYWSRVIRPGDQIDTTLEVANVPNLMPNFPRSGGPARPVPTFTQADLLVHGVQFGAEWRW